MKALNEFEEINESKIDFDENDADAPYLGNGNKEYIRFYFALKRWTEKGMVDTNLENLNWVEHTLKFLKPNDKTLDY